ncbi:Bug family tripartite tricarboxylate transporter substrate binding protein [Variovorax sp. J2P1-59]|uniref:Bug family tripartite tricarboxylate transporter substrate binding protein n=1 Tax=Variovorax flavidus TaxID=3053501 RepID=UPI002577B9BD|nr:Bug family tripartite tricarboxylate transporter substrate binding protein [Variovorax sp. J2P1-59]MDM0076309.1 Bug family tripartite tricarboxylate transporter substrate binding protein [Variovorax sp. J2P1-59]
MNRRHFGQAFSAALLAPALSSPWSANAATKAYTGPIRVLVGFPPGGATDVVARAVIDKLGKAMDGQVFIVDNKPGAGGQIAAQLLKAAPPDGSTIMLSIDHTQVIIPLTIAAAGYDPVADFTALAGVANYYNVLAVSAATGVKNMAELGAWVKAHPNEANYGIPAAGSVPQFIGHVIGKSFGVTMNSVPYKGGAPMVQDLLAGQIPIGIASMTELIEYHRAGKVRILGSSGQERSKTAPEIPTFQELGFSGIDKNPWLAFFGPKGMPPEFVDQFDRAMKTVLAQPDLQERLAKMGNEVTAAPSKEVEQWVIDANRNWSKVIRDSGFKAQ